jgi:hypothetical protein
MMSHTIRDDLGAGDVSMATMEHQIRTALKLLSSYETVDRGEFSIKGIGAKTIDALLADSLIVESRSLSGRRLFTITEQGKTEAKRPPPPAPPKGKPLKMIEPRLKAIDPMDRFRKK